MTNEPEPPSPPAGPDEAAGIGPPEASLADVSVEAAGLGGEAGATPSPPASSPSPPNPPPPPPVSPRPAGPRRPLLRSVNDRWIAGVAGGLAAYFGIDSTLVRVAIILLTVFTGGGGILLYALAWIIMPAGDESTEEARAATGVGAAAGVVFGGLLIALGVLWLLSELDVQVPHWDVVLAIALIVVGAGAVLTAGRRGAGALVALGVLLTLVLAGVSAVDLNVDGAFGSQQERPRSLAALEDSYSHAFGSLDLDLRRVTFPRGTTQLDLSVAFGEMRVIVPQDVAVRVQTSAFFGSADVFGQEISGVSSDRSVTHGDYEDATRRLDVNLTTAFGSASVDARP